MTKKETVRLIAFILGLLGLVIVWGLEERKLPPEARSKLDCNCGVNIPEPDFNN